MNIIQQYTVQLSCMRHCTESVNSKVSIWHPQLSVLCLKTTQFKGSWINGGLHLWTFELVHAKSVSLLMLAKVNHEQAWIHLHTVKFNDLNLSWVVFFSKAILSSDLTIMIRECTTGITYLELLASSHDFFASYQHAGWDGTGVLEA